VLVHLADRRPRQFVDNVDALRDLITGACTADGWL